MNEAKSIHVYGRHTLINQLFGRAVERELGVGCVVHRSFECAKERESNPPFLGLSVVDDTDEVARRRLMRYLVEPGRAERSATACFNVERTGPRIHAAVRCGVRGVFLSIDPLECVVEGLRRLLTGEGWIPSTVLRATAAPRRSRSTDTGHAPLTLRELEVLHLVANGETNEEIAFELRISPHTVKTHLYNIFQKLGVENRLNAVMWALQNIGDGRGHLRLDFASETRIG